MLAAQLNELGVTQPEAPARSRQNGKSSSSAVGGSSSSHNALPAPPSSLPQSASSILDAAVESDSDDGEDGIGVRNDGTLLASDPPKPLPELSPYRPLDAAHTPQTMVIHEGPSSSGAPNRPLPPTPDEEESGDRTLVMKRLASDSLALSKDTKVLRSIFGPVNVDNEWRARYNHELYELFSEPNITSFIKMGRLRWAGHIMRLEDSRPAIRVLRYESGGSRRRGRPKVRWEDGIREDARTIGVKNWMSVARNRDELRKLLWTARTHDGLSS
ncbi:hypothetical protein ANN_17436 [Periplaneta americana]|uniref:Uncharacterized protein n=1 Tax=Periplaneta americana TaxID=6978 RepID=A0ABQ8STW0_PERAM|nr:hypothetical protein ANN_17436 [Periplaneta americana]